MYGGNGWVCLVLYRTEVFLVRVKLGVVGFLNLGILHVFVLIV